jgi:methyl-accepting chemotaxis protein
MIRRPDQRGAASLSPLTAIITLVVILLAALLVNRVAWTADSINKKASTIQASAGSIQSDSVAVLNLDATNSSASSILTSAQPLDDKLKQIVSLAGSVLGSAKSINGTAGTVSGTATAINGTAGTVSGTASGINSTAAGILTIAQSINAGVIQINKNLEQTVGIVRQIQGDTGPISADANTARRLAACIDQQLLAGKTSDCP